MDPTPELWALLLRRRRQIEGATAEVGCQSGQRSEKEQVRVAPLARDTTFLQKVSGSPDGERSAAQVRVAPLARDTSFLRKVSGSPDCERSPTQVRVPPLARDSASFLRKVSGGSEEGVVAHAGKGDAFSSRERRRVRVPSWVNDRQDRPNTARPTFQAFQGQWSFTRQGSADSSKSSAQSASSRSASEDLQRKLKRAQRDRDEALRRAEEAEVGEASRSADLEAEAARLRKLSVSMRNELASVRKEVAERRLEAERLAGSAGSGGSKAASSSSAQRAAAVAQSRSLAEELCGHASERSALQTRLSSLSAELERQVAHQKGLKEELQMRRGTEESLQRRLEALNARRAARRPRGGDGLPGLQANLLNRTMAPGSDGLEPRQGAPAAMPPPDACFDLDDGTPEPSLPEEPAEEAEDAPGVHDLEFAYDWGLGLSGRMSVERALQLARWAARAAGGGGPGEEPSSEDAPVGSEDIYEGPLTELQRALEVLSRAAARRTSEETADLAYDQPIASLQAALARMGHAEEPEQEEAEKEEEEAQQQPEPAQEANEGNMQAFDLEVEKLQQALRRLSTKQFESLEEPAGAKADEHDSVGPDPAVSAEATAKLSSSEGSSREAPEAGATTPATAPSAGAEAAGTPTLLATPSTTHSSLEAEASGLPTSAVPRNSVRGPASAPPAPLAGLELLGRGEENIAAPMETPRRASSMILGGFGASGPAEALIFQKFSYLSPRRV